MKHEKNKSNRIKTLTLMICTLMLLTSFSSVAFSFPDVDETIGNEDEIATSMLVYEVEFPEPGLREKKVGGQMFTEIVLPGSFSIGKAGTPTFPVTPVCLLLPMGTKVAGINIITEGTLEVDTEDIGIDLAEQPIFPYQPQVPLSVESPYFAIDQEAYLSENQFPDDGLYTSPGVGYCRGYAILAINLRPTEYILGDEPKLFYHQNMRVEVNLEAEDVDRFYRSGNLDDRYWVESLVANPETISTYSLVGSDDNHYEGGLCDPSDNGGQGYDYVIITREALSDFTGTMYNWTDLMLKKQAQDLEATLVTVESILACPDYWNTTELFNDTPARIREFCRDAYQDWGTDYVLVGGDQDGSNATERRLLTYHPEFVNRSLAKYYVESDLYWSPDEYVESDLYWSNLDNTFNADHDGYWGEIGDDGFDLYSELFIGSIPCDEPSDISNWLTKSFFYEDSCDLDYLDNAAFYAGRMGWECEGDDFIDFSAIKGADDWLGPSPGAGGEYPEWLGFLYGFETWNSENPGSEFNLSVKWTGESHPNPGWQGGSSPEAKEGLKNAINNDQCTLISSMAHADPYHSMDVHCSYWESMYNNTKPFFVHDIGCHCGDMDAVDDGVLHSMLFYSDTELAFACVYNTGYGWGSYYDTNSSSALQQKLFWDYIFNLNKSKSIQNWQLGKAMAWSKDVMAPTINWDPDYGTWKGIIECCLLFGDPALTIKPPFNDLIVSDFSAEYLFETLHQVSPDDHNISNPIIKLTATIKNIGTADVTRPFQVGFYGSTEADDSHFHDIIKIGSVEIPSLGVGETAEATIYWEFQPEINIISVFVDSTEVIEESNESNNWASINIHNYLLLWNSLNETQNVYTQLSRQYKTQSAEKVARLAEQAITAEAYANPQDYINTMKKIAELEYKVGSELEGQVPPSLLKEYQEMVNHLIAVIDKIIDSHPYPTPDITWEDAVDVAEIQLQVCDRVMEMLRPRG